MTRISFSATAPGEGVRYRALRPDAGFRFVAVAEGDGYEVVREDGTPEVDGGVVLIDPFEVPAGEDDAFLAGWDADRAALAGRQGYLGSRLYRATAPADFRFVGLARWSSPLMVQRAEVRGALYLPV